jgi:hypothetical protein
MPPFTLYTSLKSCATVSITARSFN